MALRTFQSRAQPDRGRRVNAIDDLIGAIPFGVDSSFDVAGRRSVKTSCDFLRKCRIGQQVPRDLFNRELINGHVVIHRLNDPIAKGPHVSNLIRLVSVGIGVACQVEPMPSPLFAVMLRGQ